MALTEYGEAPEDVYREVVRNVGETLKLSMGMTENGNSRFDRDTFEEYIFGTDL